MTDAIVTAVVIGLLSAGALVLSPRSSRLAPAAARIYSFVSAPRGAVAAACGRLGGRLAASLSAPRRKERMDRELFDAIGTVRNIIASSAGARIPADALFEQLARADGEVAAAFRRALPLLRVNRRAEMARRFSEDVGTPMAGDLIRILARWDEVSPEKLSSTLLSYRDAIKEARTTALKRRGETLSDLVYFPAVLNMLVVLMNFIFVSYYIEQKDLFEQLFF
jgi:hypothetical protein